MLCIFVCFMLFLLLYIHVVYRYITSLVVDEYFVVVLLKNECCVSISLLCHTIECVFEFVFRDMQQTQTQTRTCTRVWIWMKIITTIFNVV